MRAREAAGGAPDAEAPRVAFDGIANRALKTGRHRLLLIAVLFVLANFVVGLRLVDVTVIGDGFEPRFAAAAAGVRKAQFQRADVFDRNGVLLASNLPTASLSADPAKLLNAAEAAARLSGALPGLDRAALQRRLESPRRFVWIKRNLTPAQQVRVNRLGLPGVAFHRAERRVYPLGRAFAHVVGFVDIDNRGIAGIEKTFDEELRGVREGPAAPVYLSVDARFQHVLREELAQGMQTFQAAGAAGVILDAATGEVLAMVSLPDFDPNDPSQRDGDARFNRASLGAYEMGSTFKVFTVAMALDAGVVTLSDGYDASEPIHIAGFVIRDYKPEKRWLSVPEIFVHSSNIGAAKMALDIGAERQRAFLSRVGLLDPAGVELPEVATPLTPSPWREINTMTIGFGHGVAVSPLQLAAAVAGIVNGGVFHAPTVVKRAPGDPSLGWRVVTPRTSKLLRGLMRLVVAEGTGGKAAVPGYLVGGKTGTAEKTGARGYRREALVSSFVAAFPIDDPRYVVLVLYDEPKGTAATFNYATGGWTAAPTVARVIARVGPMAGIPADDPEGGEAARGLLVKIAAREGPGVAF